MAFYTTRNECIIIHVHKFRKKEMQPFPCTDLDNPTIPVSSVHSLQQFYDSIEELLHSIALAWVVVFHVEQAPYRFYACNTRQSLRGNWYCGVVQVSAWEWLHFLFSEFMYMYNYAFIPCSVKCHIS